LSRVIAVLVLGCAACASAVVPNAASGPDSGSPIPQGHADAGAGAGLDGAVLAVGDGAIAGPDGGCELLPGTYTPYPDAPDSYTVGTVAQYPWKGTESTYPDGDENFSGYGSAGEMVECSNEKAMRPYLDVTDGCLAATPVGTYIRGQIQAASDDAFRVVALAHAPGDDVDPVKWTDMDVSYRFYYTETHGTTNNPGFKVFARYNDEDDLYVASWRYDGVAQIQRKQCGTYVQLKIVNDYGAPSKNAWHTIEFKVVGDQLQLFCDGELAVTATDSAFPTGTAGIRIDAMDGDYITDWKISAP
jgi:hypothetical protein